MAGTHRASDPVMLSEAKHLGLLLLDGPRCDSRPLAHEPHDGYNMTIVNTASVVYVTDGVSW